MRLAVFQLKIIARSVGHQCRRPALVSTASLVLGFRAKRKLRSEIPVPICLSDRRLLSELLDTGKSQRYRALCTPCPVLLF